MAEKFGRNYILLVESQAHGVITIQPPFTIEFDITRNILNSANVASIRIYNLAPLIRGQIEFNIYNQGDLRLVQLMAGYGNVLSTIFSGNITQAWSVREGVNFITQIEVFDGGYVYNNNTTNITFPKGSSNLAIITKLISNLSPSIKSGKIVKSDLIVTSRGKSYSGSTCEILGNLTGGGFFIDNGVANVLGNNDCLLGSIQIINASTGLLGTPVRERNIVTFDMIFEPRLAAGQYIQLFASSVAALTGKSAINGFYKTTSVKHRGMISDAVCGDCITTVSMFQGGNGPEALKVTP